MTTTSTLKTEKDNPNTPLWTDGGGTILCSPHAGNYLTSAIDARPRARTHRTPLGTWDLMTSEEVAVLRLEFGPLICETCHGPFVPPPEVGDRVAVTFDRSWGEGRVVGIDEEPLRWVVLLDNKRRVSLRRYEIEAAP